MLFCICCLQSIDTLSHIINNLALRHLVWNTTNNQPVTIIETHDFLISKNHDMRKNKCANKQMDK